VTTYTSIANNEIDADSPTTDTLFTRLRDNPIAIAEGSSGAPQIKTKSDVGAFGASPADFNDLGAFGGVWFTIYGYDTGGGAGPFNISIAGSTDNGTSHLTAVNMVSTGAAQNVSITGYYDFATGAVTGASLESVTLPRVNSFSLTMAGSSSAVNGIRFTSDINVGCVVMINPNGGEQT